MKSIVMDSEYCSMGRWISAIVADALHIKFYEAKHLIAFAKVDWLTAEYLREFDLKLTNMSVQEAKADEEFQRVYQTLSYAIKCAMKEGPCIIHERAAAHILNGKADMIKVLLYNTSVEHKITRIHVDPLYDVSKASDKEKAMILQKEDQMRRVYHDAVSDTLWGDKESYDICLDSDALSKEKCAEILIEACKDVHLDLDLCKQIIAKVF